MAQNWLPWTAGLIGQIWTARPGDTGMDCDASERITRPKQGIDFFPWPWIIADPIRATWPLMDAEVFGERFTREPTGPIVSPLWGGGMAIELPQMPKLPR